MTVLLWVSGFLTGFFGMRHLMRRKVRSLEAEVFGLLANAEQDQREIQRWRSW